jgi:hypothetical protein
MRGGICRVLTPTRNLDSTITSNSQAMASSSSLIPLQAIRRSSTSSATYLGDPFQQRNSGDQPDQQSFATGTSQNSRDYGDQREPSRSERWDEEHTDLGAPGQSHLPDHYNDEQTNTSAVDQLLPTEATSRNGEQNEPGMSKVQGLGASQSGVVASAPAPCRKINALSTIGQAALDLCIAATPAYFIGFAIMAFLHGGKEEDDYQAVVRAILNAARFVSILIRSLYLD